MKAIIKDSKSGKIIVTLHNVTSVNNYDICNKIFIHYVINGKNDLYVVDKLTQVIEVISLIICEKRR